MPAASLYFSKLPELLLAGLLGELLEQLLLLFGEFGGSIDEDGDDVGAAAIAFEVGDAVVGQLEIGAGLGAGRDFHADRTVDGLDLDFGSEGSIDHGDVLLAEDEVALAGELFVRSYPDIDIEVAFRPVSDGFAVLAQPDGSPVVDAGRDFELDGLLLGLGALPAADGADFFRDLAGAAAFGTEAGLLDVTENSTCDISHLAGAFTFVTGLQFVARLDRRAFAVFAGIFEIESQIDFGTKHRLFKSNLDAGLDVPASGLPPLLPLSAPATEETAENVAQPQVTEIKVDILALSAGTTVAAKPAKRVPASAAIATDPGMPELVIALPLRRVFQNLIRFIDLLELGLVTALLVRMVLHRRPPKRLFDLIGTGILADT